MRRKTIELIDRLSAFDIRHGEQAAWNWIAEHYFDDPDVSIGWTDERPTSRRLGGSALLGASFKPPGAPVAFSISGGLRGELTNEKSMSTARSGSVQLEQYRCSDKFVLELLSGVGLTGSNVLNADPMVSGTVSPSDAKSFKKPVMEHGVTVSAKLGQEHGKLFRGLCEIELEFTNVKVYTKAIEHLRDKFSELPDDARTVATQYLDEHLERVRGEQPPDQVYALRFRPHKDALARVNALQAFAAQAPGEHDLHAQRQADAKRHAILDDARSWPLTDMIIRERREDTKDPSLADIRLDLLGNIEASTRRTEEREVACDSMPIDGVAPRASSRQ
jgi:hypothetical protein